jgi:hypothetical protein
VCIVRFDDVSILLERATITEEGGTGILILSRRPPSGSITMMQFDSSYAIQNYREWRRQKRTRTGVSATPRELEHHEHGWALSSIIRIAKYKKEISEMPFNNDLPKACVTWFDCSPLSSLI